MLMQWSSLHFVSTTHKHTGGSCSSARGAECTLIEGHDDAKEMEDQHQRTPTHLAERVKGNGPESRFIGSGYVLLLLASLKICVSHLPA